MTDRNENVKRFYELILVAADIAEELGWDIRAHQLRMMASVPPGMPGTYGRAYGTVWTEMERNHE